MYVYFINTFHLQNVQGTDDQWPNNLADYIRHNDENLVKATEYLLHIYSGDILPCTSWLEFFDVIGKY